MNKTNKLQKILMTACLCVLFFFAATVVLRFFTRQVLVLKLGMDNGFTRAVFFDHSELRNQPGQDVHTYGDTDDYSYPWAAEYPFPQAQAAAGEEASRIAALADRYTAIVESLKTRIDNYTQDNLIFYKDITGAAGKLEQSLGWNFAAFNEYNGLYRMEDGWWTALLPRIDVTESAESVISFSEFLRGEEIDLLYVQAPFKVCKEDKEISGILDFSNQNADQLLGLLTEAGVDTLDLRQRLHETGRAHHESFFVTDHHWTGETGLWAAGEIAGKLRESYGYAMDPALLDPENFRKEVLEDAFLGSQGKKLTLQVVQPEDIAFLYPNYENQLRFRIKSIGIDLTGDFSVTYNREALEGEDLYEQDPYHAYSYGDRALIRYENLTDAAVAEQKVLLLHDSFSDVVQSFLALGLKNLEAMDLRYFDGSLESYIRENQPDLVIVMINAGEISGKINRDSHRDLFDFQ